MNPSVQSFTANDHQSTLHVPIRVSGSCVVMVVQGHTRKQHSEMNAHIVMVTGPAGNIAVTLTRVHVFNTFLPPLQNVQ